MSDIGGMSLLIKTALMDKILILAISSIILMVIANVSLKRRYLIFMKVVGFMCIITCVALIWLIPSSQKTLLVFQSIALMAVVEVLYFLDILKYTNNNYKDRNRKYKFYNLLFYICSVLVILIHTGLFNEVYDLITKLNLSVILLGFFIKVVVTSNLIWNRGNIFFSKKIPSKNEGSKALKIIDFSCVAIYSFAFIFASAHNRVVLILLALVLVVLKIAIILLGPRLLWKYSVNRQNSIISLFSVLVFIIVSSFGMYLCL